MVHTKAHMSLQSRCLSISSNNLNYHTSCLIWESFLRNKAKQKNLWMKFSYCVANCVLFENENNGDQWRGKIYYIYYDLPPKICNNLFRHTRVHKLQRRTKYVTCIDHLNCQWQRNSIWWQLLQFFVLFFMLLPLSFCHVIYKRIFVLNTTCV